MASTQAELKRLTVPQLKALCKERKITGYAKLAKDALIARLLPADSSAPTTGSTSTDSTDQEIVPAISRPPHRSGTDQNAVTNVVPAQDLVLRGEVQQSSIIREIEHGSALANVIEAHGPHTTRSLSVPFAASNTSASAHNVEATRKELKRKRNMELEAAQGPADLSAPALNEPSTNHQVAVSLLGVASKSTSAKQNTDPPSLFNKAQDTFVLKLSKKFKPLNPTLQGHPSNAPLASATLLQRSAPRSAEKYYSLETLAQVIPPLQTITMPVSLAQRKKIPVLSLILSKISQEDLAACNLVSKAFRYAAQFAAYHQLSRVFPGRRLDIVMRPYQLTTTNMWPYLVQRQRSYRDQKLLYDESFLGQALKGVHTISNEIWKNPDHELQATVAMRFCLTRVYFVLSTGATLDVLDSLEVVTDTQEVVKGEIWKVDVSQQQLRRKSFYVVEATCEVIGEVDTNTATLQAPDGSRQSFQPLLRDDWSRYIEIRRQGNDAGKCLWDHLHWTNHEEYDKAMSKHWIKRMSQEGLLGRFKIEVAKRYILACVMANGISGKWKSSQMMYQEFKGLPDLLPESARKGSAELNLFIPEHHNVESLHFTTSDGQDLHRAIAVVRTSNREYYILKDNGMQIGCEEEGIPLAWRRLLGCTSTGIPR